MRLKVTMYAAILLLAATSGVLAQSPSTRVDSSGESRERNAIAQSLAKFLFAENAALMNMVLAPTDTVTEGEQARALRELMVAHVARIAPPDSIVANYASGLAREFALGELRDLEAFFRSPLGTHYLAGSRRMALQSMAQVKKLMEEHRGELEAELRALLVPPPALR